MRFVREPRARGGRVFSGPGHGHALDGAVFIRAREIVLAEHLLSQMTELRRIFVHEVFHLVWARLGNRLRREWHKLLLAERAAGARGELGWSSEWRKSRTPEPGSGRWNEYACESFCDTASWLYSGYSRRGELTLGSAWRALRRNWFERALGGKPIPI